MDETQQLAREVKRACWVTVLAPVVVTASRMMFYWWGLGCIILGMMTTAAKAQDVSGVPNIQDLPPRVLKGMDMSHQAYQFEAFD